MYENSYMSKLDYFLWFWIGSLIFVSIKIMFISTGVRIEFLDVCFLAINAIYHYLITSKFLEHTDMRKLSIAAYIPIISLIFFIYLMCIDIKAKRIPFKKYKKVKNIERDEAKENQKFMNG